MNCMCIYVQQNTIKRITRIIQHLITIVIMASAPSISKTCHTFFYKKKYFNGMARGIPNTYIHSKQSETCSFLIIL